MSRSLSLAIASLVVLVAGQTTIRIARPEHLDGSRPLVFMVAMMPWWLSVILCFLALAFSFAERKGAFAQQSRAAAVVAALVLLAIPFLYLGD